MSSVSPMISGPPSYSETPADNLADVVERTNRPISLRIQDTRIFSPENPTRTLYHLSQPVLRGQARIIGVEKSIYRVQNDAHISHKTTSKTPGHAKDNITSAQPDLGKYVPLDHEREPTPACQISHGESEVLRDHEQTRIAGQPKSSSMLDVPPSPPRSLSEGPRIKCRRAHIYDIKPTWFAVDGDAVAFEGIERQCFKECYLRRGPLRKSWKVKFEDKTEWSCEPGEGVRGALKGNFKGKGVESVLWVWSNGKGKTMAVEVEEPIDEGEVVAGTKSGPVKTRLDFRGQLEEKELDFLVTAWVGWVAFEAVERTDPLTWSKCEFTPVNAIERLTSDEVKRIASTKTGQGKGGMYWG